MADPDHNELWVCSCEALHQVINRNIGRCCCQHLQIFHQLHGGSKNDISHHDLSSEWSSRVVCLSSDGGILEVPYFPSELPAE